jgi:division/cell wall cluster transcriptional repressor MraZ
MLLANDGDALFVIIGLNGKLWLYTEHYYKKLSARAGELVPSEDEMAFDDLYFAMATRLIVDTQGRVTLPEKCLKKANIDRDIVLLGKRDHLEIWLPSEWQARENELEPQRAAIATRVKQAKRNTAASGEVALTAPVIETQLPPVS